MEDVTRIDGPREPLREGGPEWDALTDRAQAEIFEAARSRHDGRTVPDGQATREEVINELGALRDGLRKHAADHSAELARIVAQHGGPSTWDVERVWKAQAVAEVWRVVDSRTQAGDDLVDAVRVARVALLRELLNPRELAHDVTSVYRQYARDEAIRDFLRTTGYLVSESLGLPDVSLDMII